MIKLLLLLLLPTTLFAQNNCEKYQRGYIPIDLIDAISFFECKYSEESLNDFKNKEEQTAIADIHLGTGRIIRNNWGLWSGKSKLAKYFNDLGIHHPDDMSGIILTSLHRKLNNKPIELDKQVREYQLFWEKVEQQEKQVEQQRKEEALQNFSQFTVGDKVEFLYDFDFISKKQERSWMNDKCYATGVVLEVNKEKLEIQVKLIESCSRRGIIVSEYDVYEKIDGKYQRVKKDQLKIMKEGEVQWTYYDLWEVIDE